MNGTMAEAVAALVADGATRERGGLALGYGVTLWRNGWISEMGTQYTAGAVDTTRIVTRAVAMARHYGISPVLQVRIELGCVADGRGR